MAKGIKPIVKEEESKIELPEQETVIEQPEIRDELPIDEIPPSVTLDEVKEVEQFEDKPLEAKTIELKNGKVEVYAFNPDATLEDKILVFIESKSGEVKLNDFIKSTYPPVTFAEPAKYFHQNESRVIRAALQKLVDEGKIVIKNNSHMALGDFYYNGSDPQTKHHDLNTVELIAIK